MGLMAAGPVRELSNEDRARWGECPVCRVPHGEWCDGRVGLALGRNVNGEYPAGGVHLARLSAAPDRVMEVPA